MSSILEYIHWRGDLLFSQDPLNAVDNLIFSELAYSDLEGLVPQTFEEGGVPLSRVCDGYLSAGCDQKELINNPRPLLIAAAASRRFRDVLLSAFRDVVDEEKQEQFSAVTFTPPQGPVYVAYRGTDTTLTGWREDFNLSFLAETPAQQQAARYLTEAVRHTGRPVIAGGHSKGGNLAVYAAAFCEQDARDRLLYVCSNDGPGFNGKVADSAEYEAILPKVRLFLPESSLVGVLMANKGKRILVKSTARGPQQHDPYTWEVMGNAFVTAENRTLSSLFLDETLRRWLDSLSDAEREAFTAAIFDSLQEAGDVKTVSLRQNPENIVRALSAGAVILTGSRQKEFLAALQKLAAAGGSILREGSLKKIQESMTTLRSTLQRLTRPRDASDRPDGARETGPA